MNLNRNIKQVRQVVYKLRYAGKVYYRLGFYPLDSRASLARELHVSPEKIEIMDGGKKQ